MKVYYSTGDGLVHYLLQFAQTIDYLNFVNIILARQLSENYFVETLSLNNDYNI